MVTKELKNKKRTKLVWLSNAIKWEEFPLVILAKEIEKQDWFKGTTSFNSTKGSFKHSKHLPRRLFINQEYKNTEAVVCVEWIFEEARCHIKLYKSAGCYPTVKTTKTKYMEGALERIKRAFVEVIPILEYQICEEQERERKKKEAEEYCKNLGEELGVQLTRPFSNSLSYQQGNRFGIGFNRIEETNTFRISSIQGIFGTEEIKQLIKIIGGNPRAIANRLTDRNE